MLGVTFKENCPDVRNTKIIDVITALEDFGVKVTTYVLENDVCFLKTIFPSRKYTSKYLD